MRSIFLQQIWLEPLEPLLPALGWGLGSAWLASAPDRCSAWLGLVSRLETRGLGSLDFGSRLVSGCSRSRSVRGSAYHSSGTDSVRLSSIHYLGLGSYRLVARAGLETRLGNREIGSMLDLAQLGARLRPSSGHSIGLSWGFARGSGLGIRLDLS